MGATVPSKKEIINHVNGWLTGQQSKVLAVGSPLTWRPGGTPVCSAECRSLVVRRVVSARPAADPSWTPPGFGEGT